MTSVVTSQEVFCDATRRAPLGALVPLEVRVEVIDPFVAYWRAREDSGGFYPATTGGQSGWECFGIEPRAFHSIDADFHPESILAEGSDDLIAPVCEYCVTGAKP